MIHIRKANERGTANMGWLDSKHTFSFGHYYDPEHVGFGNLRVINEDRVKPGKGFGTHGHEDMEIISYVIDGALEHKDSMDNGSVIRPGDVQRMTAGTGVRHSEFNHSDEDQVHFLQIWILPQQEGLEPGYEERTFPDDEKQDRLRLVGSQDGRDGSVTIHQDVDLYASMLSAGAELTHGFAAGRKGWAQVVKGNIELNGQPMAAGDGAAIDGVDTVSILAQADSEVLVFDMA